ncbi:MULTISPECIES: hypothetical protein [Amycolatopsis]|uniref:Apolipoprotein N-acyltransferase n=1 Tax=Amycolatopsis albidoflavus TaxID=102226 RepID=A0ABW5I9W1_9PSEU
MTKAPTEPQLEPKLPVMFGRKPRPPLLSTLRFGILFAAGTAPVLSISLYVFGVLPMTVAAAFLVIPLALTAAVLILRRSPEAVWAGRGVVAGCFAVTAYDAVRLPLVATNVWPDFIPRMGGWVLGTYTNEVFVGYVWRFLGDGGGIGCAYFLFIGALAVVRPKLVAGRPVALSVGYGIFIWTGLLVTVVVAPRGEELLFALTPASFSLSLLGHLIYGGVLGVFLRAVVRKQRPRTSVLAAQRIPRQRERSPELMGTTSHAEDRIAG